MNVLEAHDIAKSYRAGDGSTLHILNGVNLTVKRGEMIAIVGPSGAGKTTLVSLLPRFWDVTEGAILLDDQDVRSVRLSELRRAIGIVPQEPALFSGTVADNIAYARPDASREEVEAAARAAHAHEFVQQLPQGFAWIEAGRHVLRTRAEPSPPVEMLQLLGVVHAL